MRIEVNYRIEQGHRKLVSRSGRSLPRQIVCEILCMISCERSGLRCHRAACNAIKVPFGALKIHVTISLAFRFYTKYLVVSAREILSSETVSLSERVRVAGTRWTSHTTLACWRVFILP